MPLHLDNAQFNAFVSFAQNAKDVNSVAGESEPAGPRAGLRRHGSGSRPRGRTRGLPERGGFRRRVREIRFRDRGAHGDHGRGRAEYAPLASKLDLGALKAAVLQKPFSAEAASSAFKDMLDGLRTIGKDRFGLEKWRLLGVDGQQPFAAIVLKCALSGEPELTKVLAEHDEEISAGVRDLIPLGSGDAGAMIMAILPAAVPAVKQLAAQL